MVVLPKTLLSPDTDIAVRADELVLIVLLFGTALTLHALVHVAVAAEVPPPQSVAFFPAAVSPVTLAPTLTATPTRSFTPVRVLTAERPLTPTRPLTTLSLTAERVLTPARPLTTVRPLTPTRA